MSIRFEATTARTALTPTSGYLRGSGSGSGSGFTHSFNPAIGCAYAAGVCGAYCYARGFAERLGGRGTWGARVLLKENAPDLLDRELRAAARRPPGHPAHVERLSVFSSSTTDPCAGPVRDLYRECLRVVARHPVRRWVIQTRSPGVVGLREEIEALGARAVVSLTLESDDDALDVARPAQRTDGSAERVRGSFRPDACGRPATDSESSGRTSTDHGLAGRRESATGDPLPDSDAWPPGSPRLRARRRAIERVAQWAVRLHVAVSPCLPLKDVRAFAGWIARHADDATVDTFVAGDGAGGRRTASSPFPALAGRRGIDWRDETDAHALLAALEAAMPGRVGWSAAGFLRLA